MTNEQYYWYIRRNQLLNAKYGKVPGNFDPRVKYLKPYLYEIDLADFTEDYVTIVKDQDHDKKSFACSSIRKGNEHGRNYYMTSDANPLKFELKQ